MSNSFLFTSESVTEGHPDKLCDQVSDAILDAILCQDPEGHVAAECVASTGLLVVLGEISSTAAPNIQEIARRVISDIGYSGPQSGGFDAHSCAILIALNKQSPEIATGIAKTLEMRTKDSNEALDTVGAGDQGMMFGFACDETPELMPMPISAAHRIARRLAQVRKSQTLPYLRPDGKTQVTIEYVNQKPVRVDSIVISTQHDPVIDSLVDNDLIQQRIATDLKAYVVMPSFAELTIKPDDKTRYLINPSGKFVTGGPHADAGLTGRKIIVDTYGGYARHGGGAFSGKDPSKVDRSAAYAARHVAKNLVAAKLASRCEVQVSYAIGVARPLAINVTTFGTGSVSDQELTELVKRKFDLRPAAIIANFDLKNLPAKHKGQFYEKVAAYGHFGRCDLDLPWEALDRVDELKAAFSKAVSA